MGQVPRLDARYEMVKLMNEIKVKCPKCGKILRLPDSPNINAASFTCPVCKAKSRVADCQRIQDGSDAEATRYTASGQRADETQIAGVAQQSQIGRLVDHYGRDYQLQVGSNTIGRKATTSTATVQIDTQDRTMSRSHAVIEVRGSGMHILRNGANKNPSYLNGALISPSDQMVLNDGDRIKLGMTELTFRKL